MKNLEYWAIGGLILVIILYVLYKIGIKELEDRRIKKNMHKILSPKKLRSIMEKIWRDNKNQIDPSEREIARVWQEEILTKIDSGELKRIIDIDNLLPELQKRIDAAKNNTIKEKIEPSID